MFIHLLLYPLTFFLSSTSSMSWVSVLLHLFSLSPYVLHSSFQASFCSSLLQVFPRLSISPFSPLFHSLTPSRASVSLERLQAVAAPTCGFRCLQLRPSDQLLLPLMKTLLLTYDFEEKQRRRAAQLQQESWQRWIYLAGQVCRPRRRHQDECVHAGFLKGWTTQNKSGTTLLSLTEDPNKEELLI